MSEIALDFFEQKKHRFLNTVHTWLLIGGSLSLLAICAWIFFGVTGIVYAAVFGGISLFMASRVSPQIVLRMYKAREATPSEFPAGHAILDQLVERSGITNRPGLYVIPSRMMNAFAVGRQGNSVIAMTDKLIVSMSRRELAGIMAHEISHIRNEDVKVMAIADMVSRFTSLMSTFGVFSLLANIPSILFGGGVTVPWLAVFILIGAPTIGSLLQLALSRAREYDADLGAIMLTGDPDGLASALTKLEKMQARNWEGMVLPGGRVPNPSVLRTHPKTEDRIERLMALKQKPEVITDIARGEATRPDIIPEEIRRELPRANSPVPKIRRKWGRGEDSRYAEYASLLNSNAPKQFANSDEAENLASKDSINPAPGNPRIRVTRGGVYW